MAGARDANANDANNDSTFSVEDFENIFVHHLSTGDTEHQSGYKLFSDKKIKRVMQETYGPQAEEPKHAAAATN